jgi:hypothetical protein
MRIKSFICGARFVLTNGKNFTDSKHKTKSFVSTQLKQQNFSLGLCGMERAPRFLMKHLIVFRLSLKMCLNFPLSLDHEREGGEISARCK